MGFKFIREKKLITQFLDEVSQDTGKYCFGIRDTIAGLELGAVEKLICWEALEMKRLHIRNAHTDKEEIKYVTPDEEKNPALFHDPDSGVELDVFNNMPLAEWIVNKSEAMGTKLEFITDRSQEGSQFCKGFGGIGGLLRYVVDFASMDEYLDEELFNDDDYDYDDFL